MQLPPSLHETDHANRYSSLDRFPSAATIRYYISARILKLASSTPEHPGAITPGSEVQYVQIIPMKNEAPPLAVSDGDDEYALRSEQTIKTGFGRKRLGILSIEATQPASIKFDNREQTDSDALTMVIASLQFVPHDATCTPPKLGTLTSKLCCHTFYSTSARQKFSTKQEVLLDSTLVMDSTQVALTSRSMANIKWMLCDCLSLLPSHR